jgi:hypothetical protein
MDVQVNYLAVFLAAVSSMVVGSIWYIPQVFGKQWAKLAKVNLKDMGANPVKAYGLTFVASLITAFVLAHVSYLANRFFGNSFMMDAVSTAFWVWLGFTATRILVHDLFENRSNKLTVLNATHELVTLLVMGVVLGIFKP